MSFKIFQNLLYVGYHPLTEPLSQGSIHPAGDKNFMVVHSTQRGGKNVAASVQSTINALQALKAAAQLQERKRFVV